MAFGKKKNKLDVNGDGKVDIKDIAAVAKEVISPSKKEKESKPVKEKSKGFKAKTDMLPNYKKGGVVPDSVVAHWKEVGFKTELMVE